MYGMKKTSKQNEHKAIVVFVHDDVTKWKHNVKHLERKPNITA